MKREIVIRKKNDGYDINIEYTNHEKVEQEDEEMTVKEQLSGCSF